MRCGRAHPFPVRKGVAEPKRGVPVPIAVCFSVLALLLVCGTAKLIFFLVLETIAKLQAVFRTSQAAKPGHASQASQAKPDRVGSGNLQARSIFLGLAC